MPNTDGGLLLPKDIYSMTTEHENTYPTYGLSSSIILSEPIFIALLKASPL